MYKLFKSKEGDISTVIRTADNTFIPFDPDNRDYQDYLAWIAQGNEPLPADEPQA
jgi:hypothetical protein